MSQRSRVIGILVAAAVVTPVVGMSVSQASSTSMAQHITVLDKYSSQFRYLDIPKKNHVNVGDSEAGLDPVYVAGKKVGTLGAVCDVLAVVPGNYKPKQAFTVTVQCQETISLAGGDITMQRMSTEPGVTVVKEAPRVGAITGGTGKYAGAKGFATISRVSDTSQSYELTIIN